VSRRREEERAAKVSREAAQTGVRAGWPGKRIAWPDPALGGAVSVFLGVRWAAWKGEEARGRKPAGGAATVVPRLREDVRVPGFRREAAR
jgi:hypothetical protein